MSLLPLNSCLGLGPPTAAVSSFICITRLELTMTYGSRSAEH
jgi:hypothetical protein